MNKNPGSEGLPGIDERGMDGGARLGLDCSSGLLAGGQNGLKGLERAGTESDTPNEPRRESSGTGEDTEGANRARDISLGLDHVFEILKNRRRRAVLEILLQPEVEHVSLGPLSEQIAAWENNKSVDQVNWSERKRVYVGLYQNHLPKMDGMNIVAFDKSRGTIEPGPEIDRFYPYFQSPSGQAEGLWTSYSAVISAGIVAGFVIAIPLNVIMSQRLVLLWTVLSLCVCLLISLGYVIRAWKLDKEGTDGQGNSSATILERIDFPMW